MTNYNLDECYVPGILKSIADGGIVATADTLYDDNMLQYQSEINATIGNKVDNMSVDTVNVAANVSLSNLLGIANLSVVTDDSVIPRITLYNPITNVFSGTSSVDVEFGTRIVGENANVICRFFYGSSNGLSTSDVYLEIKSDNGSSKLLSQHTSMPAIQAIEYSANCPISHYVSFDNPVTIEVLDYNNNNLLLTNVNVLAVTRTTVVNLVANNLLTAQHLPTLIISNDPVVERVDYPSQTISAKLTFNAIQYMYIHRSSIKYTEGSFGLNAGRTGYVLRRRSDNSNWTISNTITSNNYYAILIPSHLTLSLVYTTFLGQNSSVEFEYIGTVLLNGASSGYTRDYKIYQSQNKVAFGDGTMTFTFT